MIRKYLLSFIIAGLFVSAAPLPAQATSPVTTVAVCANNAAQNFFVLQPWYACLERDDKGRPVLDRNISALLGKIALPIVDSLVKLSALVAAGYIFFMLVKITMARGDMGKISSAINGIRDAVIGLIIAMLSVAILNLVAGAFS